MKSPFSKSGTNLSRKTLLLVVVCLLVSAMAWFNNCEENESDNSPAPLAYCNGNTSLDSCCREGDPCNYSKDGICDCNGECIWDGPDCEGAQGDDDSQIDDDVVADDDDDDDNDDDTTPIPDGFWHDESSGLTWQDPPFEEAMDIASATFACFELAGLDDSALWRLPNIRELRTLVRGCPDTEDGGTCGVTDVCSEESCYNASCVGCAEDGGADEGCYWPGVLSGDCGQQPYWTTTGALIGGDSVVWSLDFSTAGILYRDVLTAKLYVRCMHE